MSYLHSALRALEELLTRLMTGWERKKDEILATAEEAEGESLGGKKGDKYAS